MRRIFDRALEGQSVLDITHTLNSDGIPTTNGKPWLKTTVHRLLTNEAYIGTFVWGLNAKDGGPPIRVEHAFPAIVNRREFERVGTMMQSRAPNRANPRHIASRYLLSGLVSCASCAGALTTAEAKSGKYTYYVYRSKIKKGSETCQCAQPKAID